MQYAGSPKILWSEIKPTPAQLTMAAQLGLQVTDDDTFAMLASNILEVVGDAIGCPSREVSDRQRGLAEELGIDITDCSSSSVAFVRIKQAIEIANSDAARRMELKPGDRVVKRVNKAERYSLEALGERLESFSRQIHGEERCPAFVRMGRSSSRAEGRRGPAIWTRSRLLTDC